MTLYPSFYPERDVGAHKFALWSALSELFSAKFVPMQNSMLEEAGA